MSHEIEADYVEDYGNEERSCPRCSSYADGFCRELNQAVPPTAHCDFFQSAD